MPRWKMVVGDGGSRDGLVVLVPKKDELGLDGLVVPWWNNVVGSPGRPGRLLNDGCVGRDAAAEVSVGN